ncbi:hypothetical protein D1BOALGB6SA_5639 [Olavius sp. associated proteobacterium Delta 1]|nr:hypothetical protein D1BOALGB6SA_5639 [Olavius sp. associated proteobacterium Delta 1]
MIEERILYGYDRRVVKSTLGGINLVLNKPFD